MTCLDDETVLGLVEGRLEAGVLAQIDDHLDTCTSCRDVVTHVARGRGARVLDRGHTLGRYVVGDLIGAGAMGRVYSAWEPALDRRVAVKVLQDDAPGARERLVREAQAMAKLDHPNVVGVHEVGTSEYGVYVAMDLVDGETLRAWAERGPTWRATVRVLADIARGLAAVHAAGVLHRDVKPDNVIVGADGRARIGDFGLARSGASPSVIDADATIATGTPQTAVAGTPAYMAPEVLRGGSATEASDQFGFGVTAYEVIAGHRPFEGRTWSQLLRAIDNGSAAKLRTVPGWLDAIVHKCLARDPGKRHASLAAIADLVDENARKKKPVVWIAAAASAAVLASGATWFAVRNKPADGASCELGGEQIASVLAAHAELAVDAPARAAIDRWAMTWTTARQSVCRAASTNPVAVIAARERCLDRRRAELDALLARVGTYGATPERLADALAALPPSECTTLALGAADPLPLDPQKAAAIRGVEGELPAVRAAIALGDARPVAEKLVQLVGLARASGHAPTLAEVLLLAAEAERAMSNLPAAVEAAREAVAAAERGHDDLAAARAWVERTTIAGDRRDLANADDFATIAAATIDRAGAPKHLVAKLLRQRGLVAYNRGELAEAKRLLLEARALYVAVAGERSVEVSAVESSLGSVARAADELDDAERHHRLAFEIDRELRGENHPDLSRDLHNLAGVARNRGNLDEALALYLQALALEDKSRGKTSIQSALTHNSIGLVMMERTEWTRAAAEITMARDAFRTAGHGDLAFAEHNLGIIAAAVRDHATALEHFEAAAAAYAATIGMDAAGPIRLLLDRARTYLALKNPSAARADAIHARDLAQRANILWIVEEADVLVARMPSARQSPATVVIDKPKPIEPTVPILQPPPRPDQPPKPPEPKDQKPQLRKDVGVYGSSQGW